MLCPQLCMGISHRRYAEIGLLKLRPDDVSSQGKRLRLLSKETQTAMAEATAVAEAGLTIVHYSAQPEPSLSLKLNIYSPKKCLR